MAIQDALVDLFARAARAAAPEFGLDPDQLPQPDLDRPRVKEHGDWSTNLALVLAPKAKRSPRQVAEAIVANLPTDGVIAKAEVAGPGFVNVFLRHTWLADTLAEILQQGDDYGRWRKTGRKVQVEYVSANPTGPLHIGHARNAALGDAIANVQEAVGNDVQREYYYNDAGRQMELFGRSVETRLLHRHGKEAKLPEDGLRGRLHQGRRGSGRRDTGSASTRPPGSGAVAGGPARRRPHHARHDRDHPRAVRGPVRFLLQ